VVQGCAKAHRGEEAEDGSFARSLRLRPESEHHARGTIAGQPPNRNPAEARLFGVDKRRVNLVALNAIKAQNANRAGGATLAARF